MSSITTRKAAQPGMVYLEGRGGGGGQKQVD